MSNTTDNIIGAGIGLMTLKVVGDMVSRGSKNAGLKLSSGKVKFGKIKWK